MHTYTNGFGWEYKSLSGFGSRTEMETTYEFHVHSLGINGLIFFLFGCFVPCCFSARRNFWHTHTHKYASRSQCTVGTSAHPLNWSLPANVFSMCALFLFLSLFFPFFFFVFIFSLLRFNRHTRWTHFIACVLFRAAVCWLSNCVLLFLFSGCCRSTHLLAFICRVTNVWLYLTGHAPLPLFSFVEIITYFFACFSGDGSQGIFFLSDDNKIK